MSILLKKAQKPTNEETNNPINTYSSLNTDLQFQQVQLNHKRPDQDFKTQIFSFSSNSQFIDDQTNSIEKMKTQSKEHQIQLQNANSFRDSQTQLNQLTQDSQSYQNIQLTTPHLKELYAKLQYYKATCDQKRSIVKSLRNQIQEETSQQKMSADIIQETKQLNQDFIIANKSWEAELKVNLKLSKLKALISDQLENQKCQISKHDEIDRVMKLNLEQITEQLQANDQLKQKLQSLQSQLKFRQSKREQIYLIDNLIDKQKLVDIELAQLDSIYQVPDVYVSPFQGQATIFSAKQSSHIHKI